MRVFRQERAYSTGGPVRYQLELAHRPINNAAYSAQIVIESYEKGIALKQYYSDWFIFNVEGDYIPSEYLINMFTDDIPD